MIFGTQYYPEHWPEERWEQDARLMRDAGINTLRMGEFAWSRHEPVEGKVDFSWLEGAIDLFGRHGIRTILCTCSRTPPLWAYRSYPGIRAVASDGKPKPVDHRYHVGLAHPDFRELAERIDEQVIRHFSGNPNIIAWQVDNEVGSNNDCYCDVCLEKFREYLESKYKSCDALNAAWGEHFWSFRADSFDDVPMPACHPQALLEYRRYMSSLNVEFCATRAARMRALDPGKPVTTNFQNLYLDHSDYQHMGNAIDVNGMNHYPARTPELAMDFYRGKRGKLWILEQQTHLQKEDLPDGWMRLLAWMAIAHGADAMVFFRWRQCRWGREQFGDGILPHSGEPGALYDELKQMGNEVGQLGARILQTRPVSEVALAYGYESRWAVKASQYDAELDPVEEAIGWHRALSVKVSSIDAMDPHEDFGGYKLVIAPRLWMLDEQVAESLAGYVRNGGTLCLTAGTAVVDRFGKSFDQPRPCLLRELAGVRIENFACAENLEEALSSQEIPGLNGTTGHTIVDDVHPETARVLATYADGWRKDRPAITEHKAGKGRVVYIGTFLDEAAMRAMVDWMCKENSITTSFILPENVSAYERVSLEERLLFLLNKGDRTQQVKLDEPWLDALTGTRPDSIEVAPAGVRILTTKK